MSTIKVLIIEPHAAIRTALSLRLGKESRIRVVGQNFTPPLSEELIDLAPDIVVFSYPIRSKRAQAFTKQTIRKLSEVAAVIMLTQYVFENDVNELSNAGASAVILMDSKPGRLIETILRLGSLKNITSSI